MEGPFDTGPLLRYQQLKNIQARGAQRASQDLTIATNNHSSVHQTKRCHRLRLCFAGPGNCTGWLNCPKIYFSLFLDDDHSESKF